MRALASLVIFTTLTTAADEAGRIMSPTDKSAFSSGPVRIIATAPDGRLELDSKPVAPESPFPNVVTAKVTPGPGQHVLALIWPGGRREVTFSVGPDTPAGFQPFRPHPPGGETACTQCHGLSQRGRFVFKGGCFDCHARDPFPKIHSHTAEILSECGLCHNAHGSAAKAHLTLSKELACRQCHSN
jgi:predicted CXXCH cytochrome family protein